MFLLQRPSHAEIEARLWRMYIGAEQKMEDYHNRLRFKVEDARRKEQSLVEWEDEDDDDDDDDGDDDDDDDGDDDDYDTPTYKQNGFGDAEAQIHIKPWLLILNGIETMMTRLVVVVVVVV